MKPKSFEMRKEDFTDPSSMSPGACFFLQAGTQLEITSAHVDDTGRFECRAENAAGTDVVVYDLQVFSESFFLPCCQTKALCFSHVTVFMNGLFTCVAKTKNYNLHFILYK